MILAPTAGAAEIPLLLTGEPAPSYNELSSNYFKPSVGIILGGPYHEKAVATLKKTVGEAKAP